MMNEGSGGLSAADVAAVTGMNGNGFGGNGGAVWWIVILFLFAIMRGGFGGGNGGNGDMQRGFDQQATQASLSSLQAQVGNGFADAAVARCNAQTSLLQAINANQNATNQQMNSLAMSLQQCCCDNRAATADLKYTVATEACADRAAVTNGIRDVIANNTANTQALLDGQRQGFQSVMDKLCQLELDGFKTKVAEQAAEIASLKGAISQTAQTAAILQNNEAQTANLLQRLNPNPVPAYMVQNPNCCAQVNYGCGCGA